MDCPANHETRSMGYSCMNDVIPNTIPSYKTSIKQCNSISPSHRNRYKQIFWNVFVQRRLRNPFLFPQCHQENNVFNHHWHCRFNQRFIVRISKHLRKSYQYTMRWGSATVLFHSHRAKFRHLRNMHWKLFRFEYLRRQRLLQPVWFRDTVCSLTNMIFTGA